MLVVMLLAIVAIGVAAKMIGMIMGKALAMVMPAAIPTLAIPNYCSSALLCDYAVVLLHFMLYNYTAPSYYDSY